MFKLVTVEMLKETQDKILIDNAAPLADIMLVGNVASTELNMDGNAIVNVHDISGGTVDLKISKLLLNGEAGVMGEVITVDENGTPVWGEGNNNIPTLSDVMKQGNTAGNILNMNKFAMNNVKIINSGGIVNNSTIILDNDSISLNTKSLILNDYEGGPNDFIGIDENGPTWRPLESILPSLSDVMDKGNFAGTTLNMDFHEITNVTTITSQRVNITSSLQINNDSGIDGYVLTSHGVMPPTWEPVQQSIGVPTLSDVMLTNGGNTAGRILDMNGFEILNVSEITGNSIFLQTTSLWLNNNKGETGDFFGVDETGPAWRPLSSTIPTLSDVMEKGNTAGKELDMHFNNIKNVREISGNMITINTNNNPLNINGDSGTDGYVLTSKGPFAAPVWSSVENVTVPIPTLSEVMLTIGGNTAGTTLNMDFNTIQNVREISGNMISIHTNNNPLNINGDSGISGYVLTSKGPNSAPVWSSVENVTVPIPTLSEVMITVGGNTAGTTLDMFGFDIINVNEISGNNINLNTNELYLNGSSGTTGQVLTAGISGPEWKTISEGSIGLSSVLDINNNAGTRDINMNLNDIININTINTQYISCNNANPVIDIFPGSTGYINMGDVRWQASPTGYASQPPLCSFSPILPDHLVKKDYVDNKYIDGTNIGIGSGVFDNFSLTPSLYAIGYFDISSTINGQNGSMPLNKISTHSEATDTYIIKYNSDGEVLWAKSIGDNTKQQPINIVSNSLNEVYVTGYYNNKKYCYIIKYDENGNVLWRNDITGGGTNLILNLVLDNVGQLYITGNFSSNPMTITGENNTSTTLNTYGKICTFIIKYNSDGEVLWAKSINGNDDNHPIDLVINKLNQVYLTGYSSGDITIGSTTIHIVGGTIDTYLVKFDENGNILWINTINGIKDTALSPYNSNNLTIDNSNNLYIYGYFDQNITINGQDGSTLLNNITTTFDSYLLKYNDSGNILWVNTIAGVGSDILDKLVIDNSNNIYATGHFNSSPTSTPLIISGQDGSTASLNFYGGDADTYIVKYNENGNLLWANSIGGNNDEKPTDLVIDSLNNIYIPVYFRTTINITQQNGPTNILTNSSSTIDTCIVKYNEDGNILWVNTISGNGYELILDLAIDNLNQLYLVATYNESELIISGLNNTSKTVSNNSSNKSYTCTSKYNSIGEVEWVNSISGSVNLPTKIIIGYSQNNNNTNTSLGNGSLQNLKLGSNNTALGYNAGTNLTYGNNNIYIGNDGIPEENNTVRIGNTSHTILYINSPMIPNYAYNATTGVSNTGAIGYTKYATAPNTVGILSETIYTRGTITIPVDGVYYISTNQAIFTPFGSATISRVIGYIDIYNGTGVYQNTVGTGCVPSITMPNNVINFLPFSSIYTVIGATVAAPFTFNLRLEPTMAGVLNSSNQNYNFSITRIA